jgi:UDP-N-acetylmuramoylalanine--D-glutamate ligase
MGVEMKALLAGKVAILGIGREGQVAWRYLRERIPGIHLTLLAESPPPPEFTEHLTENDSLLIGPLSQAGLNAFDLLVRSPGVSPYRKSIQQALESGTKIITPSTLWFAEHPDEKTICVTGTKGKSTTSAMIAHMLMACGYRVCLAGNIGVPLLACQNHDVDWWVIELSSYQLADLRAKPDISVILNLSSEHLDWHGSDKRYREDKLRLASLAAGGPVVANAGDLVLSAELAGWDNITWFNSEGDIKVMEDGLIDGETTLPARLPESLPGRHNLSNLAAALTVLRLVGADLPAGLDSLPSFASLPHRLQSIGERDGVLFVNDSISSTPVATVAALEAFSGRDISLIIGGLDRGLDWKPYMSTFIDSLPMAVIGIPDNGPRVVREMEALDIAPRKGLHICQQLSEAVDLAIKLTPVGGVVLLSPGAPSFPQFQDYRDRGKQFAELSGFSFREQDIFSAEMNKAAGQG